jgi:hypothetical protein
LLTRMFDLQSPSFPFVTLYALCDLPLGLTRNSASKRWQSPKDYPRV